MKIDNLGQLREHGRHGRPGQFGGHAVMAIPLIRPDRGRTRALPRTQLGEALRVKKSGGTMAVTLAHEETRGDLRHRRWLTLPTWDATIAEITGRASGPG